MEIMGYPAGLFFILLIAAYIINKLGEKESERNYKKSQEERKRKQYYEAIRKRELEENEKAICEAEEKAIEDTMWMGPF